MQEIKEVGKEVKNKIVVIPVEKSENLTKRQLVGKVVYDIFNEPENPKKMFMVTFRKSRI